MVRAPFDSSTAEAPSAIRPGELLTAPIAGFLAWLVPGLGHIYLGHRTRGLICLVTITATFWTGVAIGSVQGTIDPHERTLWFTAQMCTGGNTVAAWLFRGAVTSGTSATSTAYVPSWMAADVGVHYTGVAGLLNLLVILDALTRAESGRANSASGRSPPKGAT